MWTFKTVGQAEEPNGFDATFDGPVEDAEAALQVISRKAVGLHSHAQLLCQEALRVTAGYVAGVDNGKRRFSMNLGGGVNVNQGWSLTLMLNLADEPPA